MATAEIARRVRNGTSLDAFAPGEGVPGRLSVRAHRRPVDAHSKEVRFGRILFDGRGYVLYAFTADARARS